MQDRQRRQFLYSLAALVFGFMSVSAFSDSNVLLGTSRLLMSVGAALAAILVVREDISNPLLQLIPFVIFAAAATMIAVSLFS